MLVTHTGAGTLLVQSGDDSVELTTDEALTLFGKLSGILPGMSAPELYRDEAWWRCPHCHKAMGEDGSLIEYDSHQGEDSCEVDGDDVHVSQVDTERHTMAYLCGKCRRVVAIPAEVEVSWS